MSDTLYVLAAAYDRVEHAISAFEAIKVAYRRTTSTRPW
jgi:hypothetical protein